MKQSVIRVVEPSFVRKSWIKMQCKLPGNSRGKLGLAIGIAVLSLVFFAGIRPVQGRNQAKPLKRINKEMGMQFPSFEEVPMSPQLDQPGIKVSLGATTFKANEKVVLYGTYLYDGDFYVKCPKEAITWIMVTAIARDIPLVSTAAARTKPNLAPVADTPPQHPGPSFRSGGYFNLDLREHLQLPEQPSRYWLIVTMGDYKTDLIPFELK